jgi:dephospho-CoA kinase
MIHPAVARERASFLAQHLAAPLVVLDIPLLFETGNAAQVDKVAVVSAPASVQADRVLARPGMTCAKFAQILARQMPDEEKRRRADFVIDTSASRAQTLEQVRVIIACLTGEGDS